jgi:hypothetical protein
MKKLISTVLIILAVFQMGLPLDRKVNIPGETGSHVKFTIKNIGITVVADLNHLRLMFSMTKIILKRVSSMVL